MTTWWRRLIGSQKLQMILHRRATKYRSLLQKMTCKDKGSYESSPPCIHLHHITFELYHMTIILHHMTIAPDFWKLLPSFHFCHTYTYIPLESQPAANFCFLKAFTVLPLLPQQKLARCHVVLPVFCHGLLAEELIVLWQYGIVHRLDACVTRQCRHQPIEQRHTMRCGYVVPHVARPS